MKKFHAIPYIAGIILVFTIVACGSKAGSDDPLAQLNSLKEQKSTIDAQIAALEKQLLEQGLIAKNFHKVGLQELKAAPFKHFIDLQGRVDASESVAATTKIPGALKTVLVDNGDFVKAGQLLAVLEDAVLQKNLAELEGQLALTTDLYNRQKALWDQNIGSEVQYIQAKNNKEATERAIATLKENMAMTKIYAPTSGTVDMVMLKQGQAISPGMPLCNILNLNDLKIIGAVTEAYAAKVKKGDEVQIYFPDLDKEITTRVSYVSKSINPVNRTFAIECDLKGGDYRANQIAVMKIVDYQKANAFSIPVNLIQTAEDGDFVLIAEKTGTGQEAIVKKVSIQQGQNYNGFVEILSGLKEGDILISTGYQDVNTGETVVF